MLTLLLLLLLRPEVFLDRHRLEEGRRFDRDFMTAMLDNVLLEWRLLTELQEQGKIEYALPLVSAR